MTNAIVPVQGRTVFLGFQGEHNARTITIDVANWLLVYPEAEIVIRVRTATNQIVYPMFSVESGIIQWLVGSDVTVRTRQNGYGQMEIMAVSGEAVLRQCTMRTAVEKTISYDPPGEDGCHPYPPPCPPPRPPMPPQAPDWVLAALKARNEAQAAAQEAMNYYGQMTGEGGEMTLRIEALEKKVDGMEEDTIFLETKYDLPGVGTPGKLYVLAEQNLIVRWDEKAIAYEVVGFSNDMITGGDANG